MKFVSQSAQSLGGAVLVATFAFVSWIISADAMTQRHAAPAPSPAPSRTTASIMLHVTAGYQNIYRGTTWTPIRVTIRNTTNADIHGKLEIPQAGQSASVGAQPSFHGLYEAPVISPAGGTQRITLYVPGSGVQGQVNVRLQQGTTTLASATSLPIGVDTSAFLIGVLAGSPTDMSWIGPAIQRDVTTHVVALTPATIDAIPQALATFDLIVVTDVDTSLLDRTQMTAIERYVQAGGSLLVVGGPRWQETLQPLPASLVGGHLTALRVLPNLNALRPLAPAIEPVTTGAAAVSVLAVTHGTTLASQSGIPLVVQTREGQGAVEYLAFDPSLKPIQGWAGTHGLLNHLVAMAAPTAIARTWAPGGFRARFQTMFRSDAITTELANVPSSTIPFLVLFGAFTIGYVFVLGPVNFTLLRRVHRQHLAWVTIPALAGLYLVSIFEVSSHIRSSSSQINTIGLLTLGASSSFVPTTTYLGLDTPQSGDYRLTYAGNALTAPQPQLSHASGFSFRSASTLHSSPLGMRVQQSPAPSVSLISMKPWTMRDLTIQTSLSVPGTVRSGLTVDTRGNVVGRIVNDTRLTLLKPVVVAGQTVVHLRDLPAGGSAFVHLQPSSSEFGQGSTTVWDQLYGSSSLSTSDGFGGFGGFGDCCGQMAFTSETHLIDRIRNASGMLSQAQPDALTSIGQIVLVGWTQRALTPVSVDGSAPQRRDLTAVAVPLSVGFSPHAPFRLLSGTVGSHLVDVLPRAPQSSCCGFGPGRDETGVVSVGAGGFLTFEFDLPRNQRVNFQHLALHVSSGDEGVGPGHVYDWSTRTWVPVNLSNGVEQLPLPNRFVSSTGQILVRLTATSRNGDLRIANPYHDVQISGTGVRT